MPTGLPRIVSLLPAATEIAFALDLGAALVGVSHECDFPPAAARLPRVVRATLRLDSLSQRAIDMAVSERLASGGSLYEIDEALLRELRPDLILSQELCPVCAPSGRELAAALQSWQQPPVLLTMSPRTLEQIFEDVRALARITGRLAMAERLVEGWRERLARLGVVARTRAPPRVFFMEWSDPIYAAGHWIPEMIELAGGVDAIARAGCESRRVPWSQVLSWQPEVLIVAPCGCTLSQAMQQLPALRALPGWQSLPALRQKRIFCVDANAYFARPGPRVIEGTELLAHLIQPQRCGFHGAASAYRAAADRN